MNLPNKLTAGRLVLAVVIFVLLAFVQARDPESSEVLETKYVVLLDISMILFIVAAITDSLDGYLARRDQLVTKFGVVADPLMDKIVVGGMFVYFCSMDALSSIVAPWMVVTIITREYLVTGLRGFAESKGSDLFAKLLGKLKMVVQCVTIVGLFLYVAHFQAYGWAQTLCQILFWLTLLLTLVSGFGYVPNALRLMREEPGL